jgi:ketosteroid isomerase-like protein
LLLDQTLFLDQTKASHLARLAATLSRMFRRRFYAVLIAVALLPFVNGCTLWSLPKTSSWKNATGAEQHERLMWQAVKAKDWLNVESHIASNFVYMDASGPKDKQQRVRELRDMQVADYSLGEVTVTANANNAVVTYSLTLRAAGAGSPTGGEAHRFMSVWQQQKSGWVLVAMSEIAAAK